MVKVIRAKAKLKLGLFAFLSLLLSVSIVINAQRAYADPLGTVTRVGTAYSYGPVVEGADNNMWYVSVARGYINKTTKLGVTTEYQVDPSGNYYFNALTRGADGNVWFTMNSSVGKITPSGTSTQYTRPAAYAGVGQVIAPGPDGNMWVASYNGTLSTNYMNLYSSSGDYIKSYHTSGYVQGMVANYIDGSMWYIQQDDSTLSSPVTAAKMQTDGTVTEYHVPSVLGISKGITMGSDGNIWFAIDSSTAQQSTIGKIDVNGNFTTYTVPHRVHSLATGLDGNLWLTSYDDIVITRMTTSGVTTDYSTSTSYGSRPASITAGRDGSMWFLEPTTYKLAKIGTGVDGATVDNDGDGLSGALEMAQGTSDFVADTDRDGLSDNVESASYANRNALFCNVTVTNCEYPNPTQRDLYVETDWMVKPGVGGYSMQPNSTQISSLKTTYLNKGILAHFDTGQLGGGNAVPYNQTIDFTSQSGLPDFYDYKLGGDGITAQFNSNRLNIYHYMLFGYNYSNAPTSSGVSFPGDDDTFISYGLIKETFAQSYPFDTEIAGTAIHELGHNLCLTDMNGGTPWYTDQPATCRYFGVDTHYGSSYPSAMNYDYQFSTIDYSVGIGPLLTDHNDWAAIRLQDFTVNHLGDPTLGSHTFSPNKKSNLKAKFIPGPTAQDLVLAKSHDIKRQR